ncbi:hypothetical protein B0H14DRAFT_3133756 [Mycena olivaceomarginata]|nr:hypothetical protein B0H14DRAFT_3133756 [Mycena olivaceomarginata]
MNTGEYIVKFQTVQRICIYPITVTNSHTLIREAATHSLGLYAPCIEQKITKKYFYVILHVYYTREFSWRSGAGGNLKISLRIFRGGTARESIAGILSFSLLALRLGEFGGLNAIGGRLAAHGGAVTGIGMWFQRIQEQYNVFAVLIRFEERLSPSESRRDASQLGGDASQLVVALCGCW